MLQSQGLTTPTGSPTPVSGGCIASTYQWGAYFIKVHEQGGLDMLEAEVDGLRAIAQTDCIRVPQALHSEQIGQHAILVMEHLDLSAQGSPYELGKQLTKMHQQTGLQNRATEAPYGWHRDNFIGSTPQANKHSQSWHTFWIDQRLSPMLGRCHDLGYKIRQADLLLRHATGLLTHHHPSPSLVHGDLWTGNVAFLNRSQAADLPVIFDPAVYCGDREVDLAMSELFGSFGPEFWRGVQEIWPLAPGYDQRRTLYNLYHILNHAILFGGGYMVQAQRMIDELCG